MAKLKGLVSPAWLKHTHLAQDLMDDPVAFFKENPVKLSDYTCPKEVHDALERGRALGEAMAATCAATDAKQASLPDAVQALRQTVAANFGKDFIAETIPYGILFKERAKPTGGVSPMITGTGSCTFCKDNDSPDVD